MLVTGALNEVEGREFVRFRVGAPSWGKMEVYFLCVGFACCPLIVRFILPLRLSTRLPQASHRKKMNILRKAKKQTNKQKAHFKG